MVKPIATKLVLLDWTEELPGQLLTIQMHWIFTFCSKCLNGVLPTAVQTLQTWKSKSPCIAYRWRTKNCFPNELQKFDERTRQLMSTRGSDCGNHFEADCFKKNPGFLACQLKTRVYSHKVLLCSRENTEETSSRAKIGRQKTATFKRKQPVR